MTSTARAQDEILARFRDAENDDTFGFRREVLAEALSSDALTGLGYAVGAEYAAATDETLISNARDYLTFAIDKIGHHRGISAERSVTKLREYAWLLGRDDVVDAMDDADYPQYGAPKVKAFAEGMGFAWPTGDAELGRMAAGLPCTDDCESGCGR